jgi:acetylornithine deacetylase/succinyl-diaminopimelate desuccinylase-like protein
MFEAELTAGEGITHLLESGWKPRRTVILSHGNDEEEVGARRGQGHIAPVLEERYGKDGILMLVDEGGGIDEDVSTCFKTLTDGSTLAHRSPCLAWAKKGI